MDVAGALLIEGPIALIDAEAVYVVKSDVPEPWCEEEAERVAPDRFRWIRKGPKGRGERVTTVTVPKTAEDLCVAHGRPAVVWNLQFANESSVPLESLPPPRIPIQLLGDDL